VTVATSYHLLFVFQCIIGGTLASVGDLVESNFLAEHADYLSSRTSGIWIGLYRNINGKLLWQDNTALDFVNWAEGQPSGDQLDYCVQMSTSSGCWSIISCSSQRGFICKRPKMDSILTALYFFFTDVEKDKPHGHTTIWILLTLVLLILVGMAFMVYFLFKMKSQDDCFLQCRTLDYNNPVAGMGDESDFLTDKERNEHSVV
ncbi:MRC1 protein, partial [Nothoprocta pentlandii]|nr:MRC1 protein [Nothoprocta pentlandii]